MIIDTENFKILKFSIILTNDNNTKSFGTIYRKLHKIYCKFTYFRQIFDKLSNFDIVRELKSDSFRKVLKNIIIKISWTI